MLSLLALLACSGPDKIWIESDGSPTKRNYFLHVPDGVKKGAPLILAFHGGGSKDRERGKKMAGLTGFAAVADRMGFVVAFPSSLRGTWYDYNDFGNAPETPTEDVEFVRRIIQDVAGRVDIDRDRVYAVGISNGGFFTMRLACETDGLFAGFASVIASLPARYTCEPKGPRPVWMIAGTADYAVPFEGGGMPRNDGAVVPVEQAGRFWARNNRCDDKPRVELLPDKAPEDGTRVRRYAFQNCAASTRVDQIEGMGHAWPDHRGGDEIKRGAVCRDMDATVEISKWFLSLGDASRRR